MLECPCTRQEANTTVSSSVDLSLLAWPVTRPGINLDLLYFWPLSLTSGNWGEIRAELSVSNVIQRDSLLLAVRLHPCLEEVATANQKEVFHLKIPSSTHMMGQRKQVTLM